MRLNWARSATKHRISRERSRYVIERCGLRFRQPSPIGPIEGRDSRLVYLGDDQDGVALEVIAVELNNDELMVIHAMQLRAKFRDQYEEARRWQKKTRR